MFGSALKTAGYNITVMDLTGRDYQEIPEADLYRITSFTVMDVLG